MPRRHGSILKQAFAFALWASSRPAPPTWQEVQGYLQCTGMKARTWRRAWMACIPRVPAKDTATPAATGDAPTTRSKS